jgi:hypothetical protein
VTIFYNLLFLFYFSFVPQEQYPYHSGRPTTPGINYYVKTQQENIVKDLQFFLKDTIFNYYITSDYLPNYQGYNKELGRTYYPDDIIITNEPKYRDYDIHRLSKLKKMSLTENDRFCKEVIIHELIHVYCAQVQIEMRYDSISINSEYSNFNIFPSREKNFGVEFIEEGIAEYVPQKMEEAMSYENDYAPKTVEEITNPLNRTEVIYKYGSQYIKNFLDISIEMYGNIKPAIIIIYSNRPPTYQEILNSKLYFDRLKLL